jgi:hypothetical protein
MHANGVRTRSPRGASVAAAITVGCSTWVPKRKLWLETTANIFNIYKDEAANWGGPK